MGLQLYLLLPQKQKQRQKKMPKVMAGKVLAAHCKTTAKKRALSEKWLQLFPP